MSLKRLIKNLGSPEIRRRRPGARTQQLGVELLEARCLLTVAPFCGPVPLPTMFLADDSSSASVSTISTPTLLLPMSVLRPATDSPTTTSGIPAAPALSPAQVAAETVAGQSIDAFGLDLYQALQAAAGGSGNMLVSPFSISTALAMAYAGARGETATQMANVLHLSGDSASVAQEFGSLLADLNSAGQSDYALSVADALWGQQGMQFLSQFLDTMQTDYGGGLNQIDFLHAPEAARQTINDWVAQHTNDKIQNLFTPGSINTLTQLVLTNAIYFKSAWATAFDAASTHDASFTLASGADEQVSTMHNSDFYRSMQSDGFQVVELPYAGGRLAMDVLLPSAASGTAGLSVSPLPSDLNSWLGGLSTQQVNVSLPKFTLTTQFSLGAQLQALGMTDVFSNEANFAGLTDSTRLHISQVVHKAYIGVDETGTEAAAATGIILKPTVAVFGTPIQFNADHPFLFVVRDTQSGSVLFMGQEADPLQAGGDALASGIDPQVATPQPVPSPPAAVTSNSAPTLDINHDGHVTPADVLQVINYLIQHPGQSRADGAVQQQGTPDAGMADCDVNHDGLVSAFDALLVINALIPNTTAPAALPTAMVQPSQSVVAVDQQMASAIILSQNVAASNSGQTPELGAAATVAAPTQTTPASSANQPQLMSAANSAMARIGQNRHDAALALTGNWSPLAGVSFDEPDSP